MGVDEISQFVEEAYLQQKVGESGFFTVDRERQKKVVRQSLLADTEYYTLHLLAAAGLWNCSGITVTASKPERYMLFLKKPDPVITFELWGVHLDEPQIQALSDAFHQSEDRGLARLSMALHQLEASKKCQIVLDSRHNGRSQRHAWEKGSPRKVWEGVCPPETRLKLQLWNCPVDFGYEALSKAGLWSTVPVFWNQKSLGADRLKVVKETSVWSGYWENPDYPLPWPANPIGLLENGPSFVAILSQAPEWETRVTAIKDTVALPQVRLQADKLQGDYVPGLELVLRGSDYQVDGSLRSLVINRSLEGAVQRAATIAGEQLLGPALSPTVKDLLSHWGDEFLPPGHRHSAKFTSRLDPFHFKNGYSAPALWEAFNNNRALLGSEQGHLVSVLFTESAPRVKWMSGRNSLQAAAGHPSRPLLATSCGRGLVVTDLEREAVLYQTQTVHISDLLFSLDGNVLLLNYIKNGRTELMGLSCEDWSLAIPPVACNSLFLMPAYHRVLALDSQQDVWKSLPLNQFHQPTKLSGCTDSSYPTAVSKTRPQAIFSTTTNYLLVDLLSGRGREVEGRPLGFSDCGKYIFSVLGYKTNLRSGNEAVLGVLGADDLKPVRQDRVKVPFTLHPRGLALHSGKDSPGDFLCDFTGFETGTVKLDHSSVKTTLLDGLKEASPPYPVVGMRLSSELDKSKTLVYRTEKDWEPLLTLTPTNATLTPEWLAWQTPKGTRALCRLTGSLVFEPEAYLKGQLLIRPQGGKAVVRALGRAFSRKLRLSNWWKPWNPQGGTICVHNDLEAIPQSLWLSLQIECSTGEVHRTRSHGQLFCNRDWMVKTRPAPSLDDYEIMKVYAKRRGRPGLWKLLGRATHLALHPGENFLYFAEPNDGIGVRDLDSPGDPRFDVAVKAEALQISPGGKHLLLVGEEEVKVYSTDDLQVRSLLGLKGLSWSLPAFLPNNMWLNDHCLTDGSQIWRDEGDWRQPERELLGPFENLIADGATDLCLAPRPGGIDLLDLRTLTPNGTLHTWGNEWMVYTLDGRWDASTENPDEVSPSPDPAKRRPGLLFDLVRLS